MKKSTLLVLGLGLVATASQAGTPVPSCVSLGQARATVTASIDQGCVSCGAANLGRAIDGGLASYATLSVLSLPTQGAALRATARPGITFPAGQTAGAFVSIPSGVAQSYSLGIRTYLGGAIQELSNGVVVNGTPVQTSFGGTTVATTGSGSTFQGFKTKKAFDAVEVFVANVQAVNPTGVGVPFVNLGSPNFNVYEICSSGG